MRRDVGSRADDGIGMGDTDAIVDGILAALFMITDGDKVDGLTTCGQGGNGGFRTPGIFGIFIVLPGFSWYSRDFYCTARILIVLM
jgi:hypothetical protein